MGFTCYIPVGADRVHQRANLTVNSSHILNRDDQLDNFVCPLVLDKSCNLIAYFIQLTSIDTHGLLFFASD